MKMRPLLPKQKLRATATRRAAAPREIEEDEEPSMRLSSAFIVVVLLHLVAVGGIFAFESIKVNRPASVAEAEPAVAAPAQQTAAAPITPAAATQAATVAAVKAPAPKPVAAQEPVKKAASAPAAAAVRDSGNVHVVVKGENPRAIARKLGVSYDDLLKLNKIEDPRKLQIGQKLQIPAKRG